MLNGKTTIVLLKAALIKRHSINDLIYFITEIFRWKSESWIRFIYLCNKIQSKKWGSVDTSKLVLI